MLDDVGQSQLILNNRQQVSHKISNLSSNIGGPSEGLPFLFRVYSVDNQQKIPGSHVACL